MNTVRKVTSATQLKPKSGPQTAGIYADTTGAAPALKYDPDGTPKEVVETAKTQTLTGKTLTNPVLNGPTITEAIVSNGQLVLGSETSVNLTAALSGFDIVINHADNCVVNLPALVAGQEYRIFVGTAAGAGKLHQIHPQTGATIIESSITPAVDKNLLNTQATAKAGDSITVRAVQGLGWVVTCKTGVWARQA